MLIKLRAQTHLGVQDNCKLILLLFFTFRSKYSLLFCGLHFYYMRPKVRGACGTKLCDYHIVYMASKTTLFTVQKAICERHTLIHSIQHHHSSASVFFSIPEKNAKPKFARSCTGNIIHSH